MSQVIKLLRSSVESFADGLLAAPQNVALRELTQSQAASDVVSELYSQLLRLTVRLSCTRLPGVAAASRSQIEEPRFDLNEGSWARWSADSKLDLGNETEFRHTTLFRPLTLESLVGEELCDLAQCEIQAADLHAAAANLRELVVWGEQQGLVSAIDQIAAAYEQMLALTPELTWNHTPKFRLVATKQGKRKATGSYYTPHHLVDWLLDETVGPRLSQKRTTPLTELRILDPACGTGHFLVAAAEYIVRFYEEGKADADPATLWALVLDRCLYGIELEPLTMEICRLRLWCRALSAGSDLRLSAITKQIKLGNGLLTVAPRFLQSGIPQVAFRRRDGDIAEVCQDLRKRNRIEATSSDQELDGVSYETLGQAADRWCGAFFWRKDKLDGECCPTTLTVNEILADPNLSCTGPEELTQLIHRESFFHPWAEFRQAFGDHFDAKQGTAGFDVILGNPPYGVPCSPAARAMINAQYPEVARVANSAADFVVTAQQWLRRDGVLGFVLPKSLTYSHDWTELRESLRPYIRVAVDVSQAWREVRLEQMLLLLQQTKVEQSLVGEWLGDQTLRLRPMPHELGARLEIIPTSLDEFAIELADHFSQYATTHLGDICTTQRGSPAQRFLAEEGELALLAGRDLKSFAIRDDHRYADNEQRPVRCVQPPQAVFQNIVAHLKTPEPHIRLIGTVCERRCGCLDTVNLLTPKNEESPFFIAGLLMSDLINWYVYRCIYNGAIRTMHFDGFCLRKIPLPPTATWNGIEQAARSLKQSPDEAELWRQLNGVVSEAYQISSHQADRISQIHKPRY